MPSKTKEQSKAPGWARYRARDRDGWVYFYALEPRARSTGWVSGGVRQRDLSVVTQHRSDDWTGTLKRVK